MSEKMESILMKVFENQESFKGEMTGLRKDTIEVKDNINTLNKSMENLTLRQDNTDAKVDQHTTQLNELANEMAKQKASIQALWVARSFRGLPAQ